MDPVNVPLRDYLEIRLSDICRQVKKSQEDIESLQLTRAELAGKANQSSVIVAYVLGASGLVLSEYWRYLVLIMSVTAIVVQGLNVMIGFAGLFSLRWTSGLLTE